MRGPLGKWGHHECWGSGGTRPARRRKEQAVGIRQWTRLDVTRCQKAQETSSPQHQAMFMHRVCVTCILCAPSHCVLITITGAVFYCRAGHQSSENDSMNRQCRILPSFFYRSFDNIGSSQSFLTDHSTMSVPAFIFKPIIRQCRFQPFISFTDHSTMSVQALH